MSVAAQSPVPEQHLGLVVTLLAPWRAIIQPAHGAHVLLRAQSGDLLAAWLLLQLIFATALFAMFVVPRWWWLGTLPDISDLIISSIGPALMTVISFNALLLIGALQQLPVCHTAGWLRDTYARCVRLSLTCWPWICMIFVAWIPLELWEDYVMRQWSSGWSSFPTSMPTSTAPFFMPANDWQGWLDLVEFVRLASVLLTFIAAVTVLGRAALFARALQSASPVPAICKICGYSLQYLSRDGDCPECGTSVEQSLTQNVRRCAGPIALLRAAASPAAFVSRVVSPEDLRRARRFALLCYGLAGVLLSLIVVYSGPRFGWSSVWNRILPAVAVFSAVVIVSFVAHRLIAALVFIAWNTRGHRTPPDAFAHLMYYEAVLAPIIALLLYAGAYTVDWIANLFAALPFWVWPLLTATVVLFPPLIRYRLIRDRLRFDADIA